MRDVRHSVALYTIMSFAIIGYEDVFTIFASTDAEYGKQQTCHFFFQFNNIGFAGEI